MVSVRRCTTCGLVFADPQPVPASLNDHYGVPPEEYWRSADYSVPADYFADEAQTARRLFDLNADLKALDIGLGLGKCARVLRGLGFDVYGLEPSEPFFRKSIEFLGEDKERFKLGSIEVVDFPENMFDFITFGAVLEHIYDPSAALAKALTWLKPNGLIHIEVPQSDYLVAKLINIYYRLIGTTFVNNLSPMHVPYHLHEFTLDTFRRNGARLGYDIQESKVHVCEIIAIPTFMHGPLRYIMRKTSTGMQLTVWLKKRDAVRTADEIRTD